MSDITDASANGFVREQFSPQRPPPGNTTGPLAWVRANLFSTPGNAIMTILGILLVLWIVPQIYNFMIGHAVFNGTVDDCRVADVGACWIYIQSRFSFFIYGFYPPAEYWRVNTVFVLLALLLLPLLVPRAPFKRINALLFFVVFPIVAFNLLHGGVFGLSVVPTESWGGLMVTLIIALVGIICSLPLGIVLALGRRSKLPIIKTLCVCFIELWRAVPLITVLFMASVMLPLFMPQGMTVDKLLRALVGVTLFTAAYLAEVVRGGLAAIPRGQFEAASSLGLSYWKSMMFIVLPQALKHSIPGIVNNFISLFKDTSLVSIVGIFDLLNTVQSASSDANWATPTRAVTGYVFAGMIFWIFCFSMSRYSQWMERRLHTGHKR
ncbi:amino acid ABC transporter permease [uncultured Devosia sp.]|uniref:amino acid ABC transporter permease n=1 Tax=uncultured Devosia sp. TaxID=211434 RepID=UPI0035CBC494